MTEFIQQRAEPQTIAQQNELILELGAFFSSTRQVLDSCCPFLVRGLCLPRKRMKVIDQGGEEL